MRGSGGMESTGVRIIKGPWLTQWANNAVLLNKPGRSRSCRYPREIDLCIQQAHKGPRSVRQRPFGVHDIA